MLGFNDPKDCVINFANARITGWADGEFCTIEYDEDQAMLTMGSDGEGVLSRNQNRSATITLRLLQSSPSNDVLAAALQAWLNKAGGIYPFGANDLNNNTSAVTPTCWVQKSAALNSGKEQVDREWVLRTNRLDLFVGGARSV